jgi:hypothetical protein
VIVCIESGRHLCVLPALYDVVEAGSNSQIPSNFFKKTHRIQFFDQCIGWFIVVQNDRTCGQKCSLSILNRNRWCSTSLRSHMVQDSERLLRAFFDFSATINHLKLYVTEQTIQESNSSDTSARELGALAIETLCLWCRRAPVSLRVPDFAEYDDFFAESSVETKEVPQEQSIGPAEAVSIKSIDVLTSVLMSNPSVSSPKLLAAGAVPALVHAITTSCGHLQASACCCLQNLAACNDNARHAIAEEGGLSLLVDLARDASYKPAASAACGALQNLALVPSYETAIVGAGGAKILVNRCREKPADAGYDPYLVESAAMALKNLAAGSDPTRIEISRHHGIPVLADLLKIARVPHPKNGIIELRLPPRPILVAASGALRGLSMVCRPAKNRIPAQARLEQAPL